MDKRKIGLITVFSIMIILAFGIFTSAVSFAGKDYKTVYKDELSNLKGKKIVTVRNTHYDDLIKDAVEDAEIVWMDNDQDALLSIVQGKVDAAVTSETISNYYANQVGNLASLSIPIGERDYALIFSGTAKGQKLRNEFNSFLSDIKNSGEYEKIVQYWLKDFSGGKSIDYSGLDENDEVINIGAESDKAPFTYTVADDFYGFEIDLLVRFCKEYNYYPSIGSGEKLGMIPDAASGFIDICAANYTVTDTGEGVYYSDSVYSDVITLLLMDADVDINESTTSFWDSFEKSIIEDDRYLEYINGLKVTMQITFPSIIFGLILGFCLYFLRILEKPFLIRLIEIICLLKERVPDLVLLMIFYYVIFASVKTHAIFIAIVTFTYLFTVTTYRNVYECASRVDPTQYAAATSLGYTRFETFYLIIFPQIITDLLDRFKMDFVTHMLETSIVGLLAITDLTGAGNHVRSITYQAFAPLLVVSVIYFIVSTIVFFGINMVRKNMEPSAKKSEQKYLAEIGEKKS